MNEGEQALLECRAPDSHPDQDIRWSAMYSKSNSKLSPSRETLMQVDSSSHYTQSLNGDLFFSYVKLSDDAQYYCHVDNNMLGEGKFRPVKLTVRPSK